MTLHAAPAAPVVSAAWPLAREVCHAAASALEPDDVALETAIGRRLATSVAARCDVPHYASSAMDGWVVAGEAPWALVAAPQRGAPFRLAPGEAAETVTGAAIPAGATGVLRSEHGSAREEDGKRMLRRGPRAQPDEPRAGQHVRAAGEEARRGDMLIDAGVRLNPAHIAVVAAAGHDRLSVAAQPAVELIFTGDEIVRSGIPAAGFVRDSFGPQLPAFIGMLGGVVVRRERVPDELSALVRAFSTLADNTRVVVTTGGTGRSDRDFLRPALEAVGATLLIDGVAMRPGAPSLVARLRDGRLLVALPGNPLAATMGMLTLVGPMLAGLAGLPLQPPRRVTAGADFDGAARDRGGVLLVPFRLQDGRAHPIGWSGSAMLRGLAAAHGVLVCPPGGVAAGETAGSIDLPWPT